MSEDHEQFPLDEGGTGITPAGRFYTVIEFDWHDRFAIYVEALGGQSSTDFLRILISVPTGEVALFRHDALHDASSTLYSAYTGCSSGTS